MTTTTCSSVVALAMAALVAGCASDPRVRRAPEAPARDWVTEIRAEAARSEAESAVRVAPLADPAIDDLKIKARKLETAGQRLEAAQALEQALALRPDDPELWQWTAELALAAREWEEAERRAQRSFDLGPRLGALCVRNWLTVHAARLERREPINAESAKAQLPNCTVKPVLRM